MSDSRTDAAIARDETPGDASCIDYNGNDVDDKQHERFDAERSPPYAEGPLFIANCQRARIA